MAIPHRTMAVKSLSEPRSRPTGVRAPLTMTAADMRPSAFVPVGCLSRYPGRSGSRRSAGAEQTGRTPMLTRIDHVGIACHDLAEKIEFYEAEFGLSVVSREINEEQGVHEAMLHVPDAPAGSSYVQLVQPLHPDTPVGRLLARQGEGLHHVAYGVTDITAALATIGRRGIRLRAKSPRHSSMGASPSLPPPTAIARVLTEP